MDYASFYQGLWDCDADEDNELSFKRGELIEITSKVVGCQKVLKNIRRKFDDF